MNPPASDIPIETATVAQSSERFWHVITIGPLLVWTADFLFWRQTPGLTLGIYFSLVALAVFALHAAPGRQWRPGIACGLLLVSSVATALETSFTNTLVLLGLLAVVIGESFYREVPGGPWSRWSETLVSWFCALGRWPWFFLRFSASALVNAGLSKASADAVAKAFQAIAPAACLGFVFLVVFQSGNAVFRELCNRIYTVFVNWIENFDLSFGHFVFWFFISTVVLVLVQPRKGTDKPRIWTKQWSRVNRTDHTVAIWQSRSILFVLNALFFAVNTIDVSYLWEHAKLPTGVTLSQFVHSGVYSLIFATLLSALVLASMFQQSVDITRARGVKGLALLWIGQNLMLIAGVFLRLKLYVIAYQLSALRIYVGCFLLLVTVGFVLLALHVLRDGSLNRLIFNNMLAVFALFFVLQFVNVAGYVAQFNVGQWRSDRTRALDFDYLESLGPGAWPALCSVATMPDAFRSPEAVAEARLRVRKIALQEIDNRAHSDWRSFQFRRDAAAREVIPTAAKTITPQ